MPSGIVPKLGTAPGVTPKPEPDPESAIAGVFEALLVNDKAPFTAPSEPGLKVIANELVCPGASVKGKVSPLRPKPLPRIVSPLIVTSPPMALSVA